MLRIQHTECRYDETGKIAPPRRDDGRRFFLVLRGKTSDIYADTATEIIAELIDGYADRSSRERLKARMNHAVGVRFRLAAQLIAAASQSLPADERAVLLADPWNPTDASMWTSAVPLVLLDVFYTPFTATPVPRGNIRWLRPSREMPYLVSLAQAGVIELESPR